MAFNLDILSNLITNEVSYFLEESIVLPHYLTLNIH